MINVGEYGQNLNINVNFDISGATALSLSIEKPDGIAFAAVPTVGQVDLVTDQGTFPAKQYAVYKFQPGDLSESGDYRVRLTYTDSTKALRLVSDPTSFSVSP
jgi:hypothetical protein